MMRALKREPWRTCRVMMLTMLTMLSILILIPGCQGIQNTRRSAGEHPLDSRIRIHRSSDGSRQDFAALIAEISSRDVVFLGETHLDDITHQVELSVLKGIHAAGRSVVVSLEMFSRDRQQLLDDYLAGTVSEDQFLADSHPWNNYETGYRPIIEWARRTGSPVVAANVPRSVWRKAAFGGGLSALDADQRATIADTLLPNSQRYWDRYDRTVRGHGHVTVDQQPEQRLEKVQSLWDNTMGESVARAVKQHPGSVVVHVNGGFHTLEHDGTAHQFQLRSPEASVKTVHIVPSFDLSQVEIEAGDARADWIVVTEPVARGLSDGSLAVYMTRPLRYRIDAPPRSAGQAPLLIWLSEQGIDPDQRLQQLRSRFGAVPCLVVVEPIYSNGSGGTWLAEDHRDEDISTIAFGLQRLRQRLLAQRRLDPDRVVLAGDGDTADLIASVAIGDADWPIAITETMAAPGWFAMEGLPPPVAEDDAHPGTGLMVLISSEHQDAWQLEAVARAAVGSPMRVEAITGEDRRELLYQRIADALDR
ncbi:MAG: ChaN family lipoprotein [Planctomycetota bacterium]|nr:ChaN family lipoprotein [Planctomycetota bacterium]